MTSFILLLINKTMKTLLIILITLFIKNLGAEQYFYLSNKKSKSIDQFTMNPKDGSLSKINSLSLKGTANGFALSPSRQEIMTSVSSKGKVQLFTLSIGEKGKLSIKGSKEIPMGGTGVLSKNAKFFVQYHYSPNKISVLELKNYLYTGNRTDFLETVDHPHDIIFSNDKNLLFVPHNWENKLFQYSFNNESGKLSPLNPPYITGPDIEKTGYANFRSMVNHPKLKVSYCTYEKGGGIASLKYGNTGIKIWQEFNSTKEGQLAAASRVTISPDSRFLFMSNRKKDSIGTIAVFQLEQKSGKILKRVGVYDNPAKMSRELESDHTGRFLYSSSKTTDSTHLFHINSDGSLKHYKEFKIGGGQMLILNK